MAKPIISPSKSLFMYNIEYLQSYKEQIDLIKNGVQKYADSEDIPIGGLDEQFFDSVIVGNKKHYKKIKINQKGKKRTLYDPQHNLKVIQKYILEEILYANESTYKFNECVKGYLKDTTVLKNAIPHLNKKVVIKMDIKNFFDTIARKRIYDIFRKYNKFSYKQSYILSKIVTLDNRLPQGSPTSPFLANICAKGLDAKINLLIKKIVISKNIKIDYTRYADDITISLSDTMNYDYIINSVIEIIESEGFTPNYRKTKVVKNTQAQIVTGILVNHKVPRIQKKELKEIEFILYLWEKYNLDTAVKMWNKYHIGKKDLIDEYSNIKLIEILQGKIAFFRYVNDEQSKYLYDKFLNLNEKYNESINSEICNYKIANKLIIKKNQIKEEKNFFKKYLIKFYQFIKKLLKL